MKHILIILLAAMTVTSRAQTNSGRKTLSDPFIGFLQKTEKLQHFSYYIIQRQKSLFSEDTTVKEAEVIISKILDSLTYFHIRGKGSGEELVFRRDTGWYLPAGGQEWKVAGTGIENVKNSSLFHFIPVNLFTIKFRSEISEPFWTIKSRAGGMAMVEIDIREKPKEMTDLLVEVLIGESDSMLYRIRQKAIFDLYGDNHFQESIFRDYRFLQPAEVIPPASFFMLPRSLQQIQTLTGASTDGDESETEELYLETVNLVHLSGKPFSLPDSGLVFFDLWYTGCFPCLKSAPVIEKIYMEYKEKVGFYAVNEVDTDTMKISRYADRMGLTFPVLLNRQEKFSRKVTGSNAYPVFLIMDAATGRVVWHHAGFSENLEAIIRQALEEIL